MTEVKLAEVASINPRDNLLLDLDAPVSFLPMASVSEQGSFSPQSRLFAEVCKGYTPFQRGDVIVAKITPCFENGKAAFIDDLPHRLGFASTEFHVLRPGPSLDPRYLFRIVTTDSFRLDGARRMTGSAGQQRVPSDFLRTLRIPLPSLEEQKRIAAILDKADAIRRKREQAIQLADEFLRSLFLDMFGDPVGNPKGWPITQLGCLCSRITDGTHQPPTFVNAGVPFLFVSNVVQGSLSFESTKYISERTWSELTRRCPIDLGDILYTTVGSYGNAAEVRVERPFAFQRHIAHVKPIRSKINSQFLAIMLNSPGVKRQADSLVRGIAQKTLNLRELRLISVFDIPKETQDVFLAMSDRTLHVRNITLRFANETQGIAQSLNSLAFRSGL